MDATAFSYRGPIAERAATGYQPRRSPLTPVLRWMVPRGIFARRTDGLWTLNHSSSTGPPTAGWWAP